MSLPATDNFNRGTSATLGANWTDARRSWGISGSFPNAAYPGSPDACASYWSADSFSADQYAQCLYASGTGNFIGVGTRITLTGGTTATGYAYLAGAGTLYKFSNDSFTSLQSGITAGVTGDTTRLETQGTSVRAYINGSQVGTTTSDATYGTGAAGLVGFGESRPVDDWGGGNIGGAAGRTTKNTRAWPLGLEVGMGWRMPA